MSLDILPSEILLDIFLRLPSKALLRCTTLSHKYKCFITSPDFIQAHMHRIKKNSQFFLRFCDDRSKNKEKFVFEPPLDGQPITGFAFLSFLDNNENERHDFAKSYQNGGLEVPIGSLNERFNVVGSINGVICLSDDRRCYTNVYVLWNPTIRKWVRLPRPLVTYETHGPFDLACGFGYDSDTIDYKVVRVVQLHSNFEKPAVEVYSLKSGYWRVVEINRMQYLRSLVRDRSCCLQGIVHWIGYERKGYRTDHAIVAFNVCSEVFEIMGLPWCLKTVEDDPFFTNEDSEDYVKKEIVEYKGMLAVSKIESRSHSYDLWVMKEYGVVESWSQMFSFRFPKVVEPWSHMIPFPYPVELGRRLWTYCFGDDEEIIIPLRWRDSKCRAVDQVAVLDTKGNIQRVVGHICGNSYHIAKYMESLALLDARQGDDGGSPVAYC